MRNSKLTRIGKMLLSVVVCLVCCMVCHMDVDALTIDYDKNTQEIIISGVPESNNDYFYSMYGNLKYKGERVESFCYGMPGAPYDIPSAQAYIFTYEDHEFIMPGSGTYVITAWIETIDCKTGEDLGKSQKTSLEFEYIKKDPSTDWGPGLPPTMIEDWELENLHGTTKDMVVSEGEGTDYPYTWTINGADVYNVPAEGEKVNLQINSMDARFDAYIPGEEIVNIQMDIAHSGDFGFHAKLDYTLGAQYAGKYANLFYIVEPGKYDFIQSCQIDANGVATFILNHASSYIVVIRDEEYTGEPIVQATPAPTPEPTPVPTPEPTPVLTQAPTGDVENTDVSVDNAKKEDVAAGSDEAIMTIGAQEESDGIGAGAVIGIGVCAVVVVGVAVAYFVIRKKKEE